MKQIHKDLYEIDFDEEKEDFARQRGNSDLQHMPMNQVANASIRVRNVYIIQQIEKLWYEKK